jgi:hypothetical protein
MVKDPEVKIMTAEDHTNMGSMCAGAGCGQTFTGVMPPGWRWMLMYHSPAPNVASLRPGALTRDCALCPDHAKAVDDLLVELTDERLRVPGDAGTA